MTDTYIVGFDGTAQSRRAADYAAARAKASGGKVHLVLVLEWSPYSFHTPEELAERHGRREQELERANATVQPVVDELNKGGVTATCEVRHGHAADLLCKIASDNSAAQIVIGRTGDSALAQRILGGLAITLAQVAPVPVTIVP
jgi:nucleotide-binding universal stress UspA family protein